MLILSNVKSPFDRLYVLLKHFCQPNVIISQYFYNIIYNNGSIGELFLVKAFDFRNKFVCLLFLQMLQLQSGTKECAT